MANEPTPGGAFESTRWSMVRAAADPADPQRGEALAELCRAYWPPVYAFLRRQGHGPDAALDLAQGFFARFLEKEDVRNARQERGRFRTFLLACVKHYVANERDRARAEKRGGGRPPLRLDRDAGESLPGLQIPDPETPETVFDRQWTLTLLERVLRRLEEEAVAGDAKRFTVLKPFLTDEARGSTYREAGERLGMTEGAVKVAVHRLRRRFGALLRAEVADTVTEPSEVDEEIRFLFKSLA